MVDMIKCPVCGEGNLADQEFCQFCQSRLKPVAGKSGDAPLMPGQIPTKKNTAELEPILPQWLKDARDKARQSIEDDSTRTSSPAESHASEPDLLAGLQSQAGSDDEDETPDWLASITGESHKSKKAPPESSEVRWVELGDKNDFAQDTPQDETPSWLAGLQASAPAASEEDELTDWLRNDSESKKSQPDTDSDWLKNLDPGNETPSHELFNESNSDLNDNASLGDTPEWLRQMDAQASAAKQLEPKPDLSDSSGLPDWFAQQDLPVNDKPVSSDLPAWLNSPSDGDQDSAGQPAPWTESGTSQNEANPDWLKGLEPASTPVASSDDGWLKDLQQPEPQETAFQGETPSWLKKDDFEAITAPDVPAWLAGDNLPASQIHEDTMPLEKLDASFGDIPDWLKAAAPQSSVFDDAPSEAVPTTESSDTDWLASFKSSEVDLPDAPFEKGSDELVAAPAFTADTFQGENADLLFQEMPDWLSNASDAPPSSTPTPITSADAISPGELPSWVQAMRPVDPSGGSNSTSLSSDQTLETRGALSGLQGVLPAVPGYAPSSKPKAYSIRLQVSEEQQSHAALLEQILAAEAEPEPIASFLPLAASRSLRWLLTIVIFSAVLGTLLLGSQFFSMPVGMPAELAGALQAVQAIPEGAPVLVATDYQPSLVSEMEAAAAPVFDQMLLLRHPRLTFISTSETGGILTERFIAGPLAGHSYENRVTYLNLGYLPGGLMGIRAFSQNPSLTMPYDIALKPAWDSAPVQGVSSLSQFAAIILITDNADSARAWIEQTTSLRGSIPFVVISSAQASPMIQPYYNSEQINGLVSGLYGGALFEQNNAGRPGTARKYWDAYSVTMLLTMAFVVVGGLWNLALGMRDRNSAKEGR